MSAGRRWGSPAVKRARAATLRAPPYLKRAVPAAAHTRLHLRGEAFSGNVFPLDKVVLLVSAVMSLVVHFFPPASAVPSATSPAAHDLVAGSQFPVPCLDFDATSDEQVFFYFRAVRYRGGSISVEIDWYADTASSGNVVWEAALACISPDVDVQDVESKAFAAVSFVQDAHLGGIPQRLHRAALQINDNDGMAADDWCVLRLRRDADGTHAADDLPGDASVVAVALGYDSV